MDNLSNKTAFITGGASGIGLGIAQACAQEGMNVVIADLRQNAIDEALLWFNENNKPALGICLDVTDRVAYEKAADEAESKFGNLHVLVNNAGIGGAKGPLWDVSYKETDLGININLTSVLNGIQIIVPRILKHGEGGHIVSTASKAALIPVPGNGIYNLTKQAVVAIMETLATDLQGKNVGASVFCPGPFLSNLGQTSAEIETERLGKPANAAPPPPPPKDDNAPVRGEDFIKLQKPAIEAGLAVVRGIKRGDLYILTHPEFKKGYEARVNAILRAFPDREHIDRFTEVFSFLTYNPVFDKQTQVPGL